MVATGVGMNERVDKSAGSHLSPEYLLSLARRKGAESRSELAAVITDLFSDEGEKLTKRERMLMYNILKQVCHDIEVSIRKHLSERLSERRDIPGHLINALANDNIDVAYPILTRSRLLRNKELIEIVRHRTYEHQLAIASRRGLAEQVSDALVKTGRTDVILTLLENRNALISEKTLAFLVEESSRVDDFQEPILRREELPDHLAKRMFLWVSEALRKHIIDTYGLEEHVIDDLLKQVKEIQSSEGSSNRAKELAKEIQQTTEINAEMMIAALDNGQVRLFINLLARRASMREQLVKRMLYEPGGEGLAITFKALGFKKKDFLTVFAYSRRASPNTMQNFAKQKAEVTEFFETLDEKSAQQVLRNWQRNRDYPAAARQLDI